MPQALHRYFAPALAVFALASVGHTATIAIDTFDGATQIVRAPSASNPPVNPDFQFALAPEALGGVRGIGAFRATPAGTSVGPGNLVTVGFVDAGEGGVTNAAGAEGVATFRWETGGVDLVDGTNDRISLDVTQVVAAAGSTVLPLTTFELTIGGVSVGQVVGAAGQIDYAFADFAGVDFANVQDITLLVSGTMGFSTRFDDLRATSAIDVIPLPAGGALLLSAFGVLACVRRRANSQARKT